MDINKSVTQEQLSAAILRLPTDSQDNKTNRNIDSAMRSMCKTIGTDGQLLLDASDLAAAFDAEHFKTFQLRLKQYCKQSGKNTNWPSLAKRMQGAYLQCLAMVNIDLSTLSFSDALKALCERRYANGGKLSNRRVAKLLNQEWSIRTESSIRQWFSAKGSPKMLIDEARSLDTLLNADGALLNKIGLHMPESLRQQQQVAPFAEYDTPVTLNPALQQFYDSYSQFRITEVDDGAFVSPYFSHRKGREARTKGKIRYKKPYKVATSGVCGMATVLLDKLKLIQRFYQSIGQPNADFFLMLDEKVCEQFKHYILNLPHQPVASAIDFYLWLKGECREQSFIAVKGVSPGTDTYDEHMDNLTLLRAEITDYLGHLRRVYNDKQRDSKRHVRFLIHHADPIGLYRQIRDKLYQCASTNPHDKEMSSAAIVFDMAFTAPLRRTNLGMLQWLGDLSAAERLGLTHNHAIGVYRYRSNFYVFVHQTHLKNSASKISDVHVPLKRMNAQFEAYLTHRHLEVGDRLLCDNQTLAPGKVVYAALKRATQKVLYWFFPRESMQGDQIHPGINPHGLRHLAATLYLLTNKEDYVGLATLLMDELKTVLGDYAGRSDAQHTKSIAEWGERLVGEYNHA